MSRQEDQTPVDADDDGVAWVPPSGRPGCTCNGNGLCESCKAKCADFTRAIERGEAHPDACPGPIMQTVAVVAHCPLTHRSLNKAGIRSRDVEIAGVDWPGARLWCKTCGWSLRAREADPTTPLFTALMREVQANGLDRETRKAIVTKIIERVLSWRRITPIDPPLTSRVLVHWTQPGTGYTDIAVREGEQAWRDDDHNDLNPPDFWLPLCKREAAPRRKLCARCCELQSGYRKSISTKDTGKLGKYVISRDAEGQIVMVRR